MASEKKRKIGDKGVAFQKKMDKLLYLR